MLFKDGSIWVKYFVSDGEAEYINIDTLIISKKFGFIQWLVDNGNIDIQWTKNLLYESEIFNLLPYTNLMECLIMYLAIQDDPINFLVSILK